MHALASSACARHRHDLIPSGRRIAQLAAAAGAAGREIAAQLFPGARIARYHFREVFSKLDATARIQFGDAVGGSVRK